MLNYDEILLTQIPETGLILNITLEGKNLDTGDLPGLKLDETVSFKGMIHAVSSRYVLSGRVKTAVTLSCDRCLSPFKGNVEADITVNYITRKLDPTEDVIDAETDDGLEEVIGTSINLKKALMEQIILQIPMKTICSDDCKGLCSQCGIDLNKESCDCDRTSIDPRLLKLKDLLKSEE